MTHMPPVAIIGMAGRFPGAATLDEYWRNLSEGVECITRFSEEELRAAGIDPALLRDPNYVRARGVLADAELFDAAFFGFSAREAEVTDPQHRIFLEVAWEALERAGYAPDSLRLPTGVFAGTTMSTYLLVNLLSNPELLRTVGAYQTMIGNDKDFLTTRVSYKLDLHGPSMDVQTACSTSLVAVQVAVQSLLTGQCDLALAGGVSLTLPQRSGYLYQPGMIASPNGQCRAFDADAHGTVSGEGAGVVVLRRLEDALHDGDHIRAVIRGAAINNDGSLKVGYTAPSVDGQAEAIARAQEMGGVAPETISYVEAHGTGTELGDPIEIAALTKAFRRGTDARQFCAIGAVKTNIGHLDAAAGVAGLIKTVLAFEHELIPPSLHFERPNPQIDFESSPFFVNAAPRPWPRGAEPRRAGVSSFGIGGTNAHVVLEEAPRDGAVGDEATPQVPAHLLTLSARTPAALDQMRTRLAAHLRAHPDTSVADAAFTLQRGRKTFPHRLAIVGRDGGGAAAALEDTSSRHVLASRRAVGEQPVAFLFPGQGAQHPFMARGLYESDPAFRADIDACASAITPSLGMDIRTLLFPGGDDVAGVADLLRQTHVAQPALFIVEYAVAQLWMRAGITPDAMLGHSIGEYVAACLSGVLDLDDALRLVVERGRVMDIAGGAMLAIPLPADRVNEMLTDDVDIAAVNAPALCVASGPTDAIARLEQRLAAAGTPGQRLHTAHAFHSRLMEPALAPFAAAVGRASLHSPRIPYLSNVTGTWITERETLDPDYWVRHIRSTVRFSEGMTRLLADPERLLLEVGPGHTLATLARQHEPQRTIVSTLRHPRQAADDRETYLTALGSLWVAGAVVDWNGVDTHVSRRRTPLPTYPFERQRYWAEPRAITGAASDAERAVRKNPELGEWFFLPSWERVPARPRRAAPAGTTWMVVCDAAGTGARIVARLRALGETAVAVEPGERFAAHGTHDYTVRSGALEDQIELLRRLQENECLPTRILHCGALASPAHRDAVTETARRAMHRDGFQSLTALVRAMGARHIHDEIQLAVLTDGLQDVAGEPVALPERGTVLGACMVVSQEHTNIVCRCVDLLPHDLQHDLARTIDGTLMELDQPRDQMFVALRGAQRWLRTFVPFPLEDGGTPEMLREHGVYLITGGLGGIGLTLARYLARTRSARLALLGRSPLPPPEAWDAWVKSHAPSDETTRRILAVRDLEAAGAEVLTLQADVADAVPMRRCVDEVRARFGALHGVIHAAGALDLEMIQERSDDASAAALASKVEGAAVLLSLVDASTDFVVLCSSVSATLGGIGRAEYAGGNSALDAFARARAHAAAGPRVVAIGWDSWRDVGMSVTSGSDGELAMDEATRNGIRPEEGAETFARALQARVPEIIVSARELPYRELVRRALPPRDAQRVTARSQAPARAEGDIHERPAVSSSFVEPASEAERAIAGLWQQLLGIERVGSTDDFFELGGHSLLATQLISRLRETFGVSLPLRALFDATTVAAMAERIELLRWGQRAAGDPEPDADREEIEI